MKKRCHNFGFTLVELLLVILILGIMAAVVVPFMGGLLEGGKAAVGARSVAQLGRYARSMALSTQTPMDLILDLDQSIIQAEVVRRGMGMARASGGDDASETDDVHVKRGLENVKLVFGGFADRADGRHDEEEDGGIVRIRYRANGSCRPYRIFVRGERAGEGDGFIVDVDGIGVPRITQEKQR